MAIHELYGPRSVFWDEMTLCDALKASYDRRSNQSPETIFRRLMEAELLVFDDLGVYETDNRAWMLNIYRYIFNNRCERGKAVLITTNIPLFSGDKDNPGGDCFPMEARIGGRNFDRLMGAIESTAYYIDLFGVPSYRMRKILAEGNEGG